ncbi:MAG: DoxX family membrane protein [Verrucomicrobia bacterium]|nr:DoxX family membrane protein [Verrucomicrobiota bacterium]
MKVVQICLIVLTRFILSSVFLASAVGKIFHWQETEHDLIIVLSDWQNYASFSESFSNFFGALTPWTSILLLFGILMELGGGLLVLLGIREKLGAGLLLLFMIPATVLCHQFWFIDGSAREIQTVMFLKNLAIMGGLIMVMIHGAQASPREGGMSPLSMG